MGKLIDEVKNDLSSLSLDLFMKQSRAELRSLCEPIYEKSGVPFLDILDSGNEKLIQVFKAQHRVEHGIVCLVGYSDLQGRLNTHGIDDNILYKIGMYDAQRFSEVVPHDMKEYLEKLQKDYEGKENLSEGLSRYLEDVETGLKKLRTLSKEF